MARLLLGVSGGIAAYKALETARLAIKAGHAVRVIQTPDQRAVRRQGVVRGRSPARPCFSSEFEPDPARGAYPGEPLPERAPISHLALVERADVYLIAPASANTIAKLAHGHADNLLSTAALAAACPVAVAPAMNNRMYLHPATQANLRLLARPRGHGDRARRGRARVARRARDRPPGRAARSCSRLRGAAAGADACAALRVLVTAGGTREPIDSVRFIGNRSSGRMGFALAAEAARRGAEVTLDLRQRRLGAATGRRGDRGGRPPPSSARACEREFAALRRAADGRRGGRLPSRGARAHKLKKDRGRAHDSSSSRPRTSSARWRRRGGPARSWSGSRPSTARARSPTARGKLERKRLDAVVVNDISRPASGSTPPRTRSRS